MARTLPVDVLFAEPSAAHLLAAAKLVSAGRRVALLRGESELPGWAGPGLGLLPPAGAGTLLEELFAACDVAPAVRRSFRRPPILLQVLWPGYRIDVASDPQSHRRGLERELGSAQAERVEVFEAAIDEDLRALRRAIAESGCFPPTGLLARFRRPLKLPGQARARLERSLEQALTDARLEAPARHYLKLRALALGVCWNPALPLAAAAATLAAEPREHALVPPPETPELTELLQSRLAARGVELLGGRLNERRHSGDRWEVSLSDGTRVNCRALVEGERALEAVLARKGAALQSTRTLRVLLRREVLPVGMCPRGILAADPAKGTAPGNLVLWAIERPEDEAEPARLWLTLPVDGAPESAAGAPGGKRMATIEPPGRLKEAALSLAREAIPFLDRGLVQSTWLPPSPTAAWVAPESLERHLGLAGAPYEVPGKRHFALGRANLPTLGLWGELSAALAAAQLIEGALGERQARAS